MWRESGDRAWCPPFHHGFISHPTGAICVHRWQGDMWRESSDRAWCPPFHHGFISHPTGGICVHRWQGDMWGESSDRAWCPPFHHRFISHPTGGFGTRIVVKFTHDQGYVRVSTCALEVYLPLHHRTLSSFTEMMVEAVISSPGFGRVWLFRMSIVIYVCITFCIILVKIILFYMTTCQITYTINGRTII